MPPSPRLDRVFDSYAWVEYFRGTPAGEVVADELDVVAALDGQFIAEMVGVRLVHRHGVGVPELGDVIWKEKFVPTPLHRSQPNGELPPLTP